jgi:hypothetical protein
VDPHTLAADRNIVDGLHIGHPVEERIWLLTRTTIRNRTQAFGKRQSLGSQIQFEDIVLWGRRWRDWIREFRRSSRTIRPENGVKAIAYKVPYKE